jgi:hypothetical protein
MENLYQEKLRKEALDKGEDGGSFHEPSPRSADGGNRNAPRKAKKYVYFDIYSGN